jgi:AmmeMemoRadiSam system protein B
MAATIRHPAVAGRFYPRDRRILLEDIRSYLSPQQTAMPAIGCVAPHAGYMYSGAVAGAVYSRIEVPASCIVLCPNHTGMGEPLSIISSGEWETPLGLAPVDSALAHSLKERFPLLKEDTEAHRTEHAIEVQLPFLQERRTGMAFLPIALGTQNYDALEALGRAVAEVIAEQQSTTLIVASSDMNHYESDAVTRIKDRKAIDRMLALDPKGLYDVVMREDISMCGLGPAVVMLTAANRLGARSAQLVKYATSSDVSGDHATAVGYAGIVVR